MAAPNLTESVFWRGMRDALPFLLVFLPFGMLFGIAGTAAGLNFVEVMGFTVLVVAGASQFTAIQLMQAHGSTVLVIITALAVNLRMAMYSAALAPTLGRAQGWKKLLAAYTMTDQSYLLADTRYEARPEEPLARKLMYYWGTCTLLVPAWIIATLLGAVFGAALPSGLALDFAVPVTFLAMVGPALRSPPHLVAAGVSVIAALALGGLPTGTGVLAAAALAMWAGATTEVALARLKARREGLDTEPRPETHAETEEARR